MKRELILFALAFSLSGCHSLDRMLGNEEKKKEDRKPEFYVVSCCRDNDGFGNMSYPAFLPASHVALCESAHRACHDNDCLINGDVYLPMSVDCGTFGYKIGDEYYKGKGY